MTPGRMGVDPDQLIIRGSNLVSAASNIPDAPQAFTAGTDQLSMAIKTAASKFEEPIHTGLPALKVAAQRTAQSIVDAGRRYQQADDDLARRIQGRTALPGQDGSGAGGAGSGGGAGGGGIEQLSQLMGMPMQLAGQMAQIPMQAMGALGSLPQSVMQGVQQLAQLGGGGKGEKPGDAVDAAKREADERREAEEKAKAEKQKKAGAAPAQQGGERAPVTPAHPTPGPEPRHARPAEPSINL